MTLPDSFLKSEIFEQPQALQRLLTLEHEHVAEIAAAIRRYAPRYIVIAARGTSDNAARYGQYLFGAFNRLAVALATPSLYTLYQSPPNLEGALVIGVSQSGASPDIVSVVEEGRRQGALTVAVTNNRESALAGVAEHMLYLHAGEERSVAATKTYTTSLLALAMLSATLAQDETRLDALGALPTWLSQLIDRAPEIVRAAERYRYAESCVTLGRGYNYATAFEIALKLKELTYILAEPYSSADFAHGPIALVAQGFPVLAVVPEGIVAAELIAMLKQFREREAELIVISALPEALALAQTPLPIPAGVPEWLSPLVAVVPGQILALGLTLAKGYAPDHPRGLRKVTLTR